MFFLIFLLLILLCAFLFIYSNMNKKISNQKKQLIFLVKNNDELKDKLLEQNLTKQNNYNVTSSEVIEIKYKHPNFSSITTPENCILYAAPFENSPVVSEVSQNTPVEIQDSAIISNTTWYEVNIPSSERINSKGWIKQDSLLIDKF
ncbi:SH3 domain-containing protein [Clostridium ganghwense]|uniref:SH3 domain-containing protein n=1 Tax=Clostridium ganghwense TaxID=312089 RepID=A0ABT4CST6_9CLOT|nr:SH3 domain-containing protein [Clostridium ganghwense]MCY6371988.1 SH3 domain-containing protein [Clostridium ganghwense]